jgi:hypothetical protein
VDAAEGSHEDRLVRVDSAGEEGRYVTIWLISGINGLQWARMDHEGDREDLWGDHALVDTDLLTQSR